MVLLGWRMLMQTRYLTLAVAQCGLVQYFSILVLNLLSNFK